MKIKTTIAVLLGLALPALTLCRPGDAAGQVTGEGLEMDEGEVRRVTLDEALELVDSNLELRIARSRASAAGAEARQAAAYPNPTFVASHEMLDESGREISESYLTLSQRLEWPGARSARRTRTTAEAAAAGLRASADSATLALEVKRTYVTASRRELQAATLERVTTVFRSAEESARERYEEGDVSLYDLRRIEVERLRYEAALADTVLELDRTRRELARLVAPESPDLRLAPAEPPRGAPPAVRLERPAEAASGRRFELSATEADVSAARATLEGVRARRVPDLTANGGYKRQSDGFTGIVIGLSTPLPLWNRSGAAIQAADARLAGEEARLALRRREIEDEARQALDRYRSQVRRAELLSETEGSSADLLEIAQVAYENGEMELIELLDAAEALLEARSAAIRIQSDLWTSYFELERAIGGFGGLEGGEDQ